MAELVDALLSGSSAHKAWRFESSSGHHLTVPNLIAPIGIPSFSAQRSCIHGLTGLSPLLPVRQEAAHGRHQNQAAQRRSSGGLEVSRTALQSTPRRSASIRIATGSASSSSRAATAPPISCSSTAKTTRAPRFKALLEDPKTLKIFHFARFDLAVLEKYLGVAVAPIYCTKIASKLVRTYTDRHGLKDLCAELAGVELSKQQQSSDWGAAD